MVTSYTQQVQNQAKCPHGFPLGACPICNGMAAGGTKRKDKPRVPGEMSYNECLAQWHKMLALKEAKLQDKLDKIEANKLSLITNRIIQGLDKVQKNLDKFMKTVENAPALIKVPVKFIIKNIIKPVVNLIASLPNAIKNIQTFFENTRIFINSVSEKLSSFIGEIKNFAFDKISKTYEKIKKTILNLFISGEEEDEESKEISERELKKILKSIFRIKNKEEKE